MVFIVQRVEESPDYHTMVDVSLCCSEEEAKERVRREFNKQLDELGSENFTIEEDPSVPCNKQRWAKIKEDGDAWIHDE